MRAVLLSGISFLVCFGFARWTTAPVNAVATPARAQAGKTPTNPPPPAESNVQAVVTNDDRLLPLREALSGNDPLASAAAALRWIENASREDLAKLAEDPEKRFLFPTFPGFKHEFRDAFFAALLDRWLQVDPEGARDGIIRVQGGGNDLFVSLARTRPLWVLEQLPFPQKEKDGSIESHVLDAVQYLAAKDPAAARAFLPKFADANLQRSAGLAIAHGVATADPVEGVILARRLNAEAIYTVALASAEKIGGGMVRQVIMAARGKLDSHYRIPELLLRFPDLAEDLPKESTFRSRYISDELMDQAAHLSMEERAAVLAKYESLPDGTRENIGAAIASHWARTEPAEAAEWALSRAKPDDRMHPANQPAEQALLRWINKAPEDAIAWWRSLPASPLREALGTSASTFVAENGDLDTAMEMFSPGPGESDGDITAHLTQFVADRDPAKAAAWLRDLPAHADAKRAMESVVHEWYAREPAAVAKYIEEMPEGTRRDQALNAFVQMAALRSPRGAAEWVETVTDAKMRQTAVLEIYWRWSRQDPAAALEWMQNLKNLDPAWHARILRQMQ
ncbi:MAG: hypothetical protein ACO1QR_13595 [Chthoniobacteraceae bacterium]